jgi:hypothetical protein
MGRFDALTKLEEQTAVAPPKVSPPPSQKTTSQDKGTSTIPSSSNTTVSREEPKLKTSKAISDTVIPRYHDTINGTVIPLNHDTTIGEPHEDISEVVRKAVKHFGKEAATHRFTLDKKNLLADIEYAYKRQGVKTSENEITRIAINYFIEDYRRNGEGSLLAQILKLINS